MNFKERAQFSHIISAQDLELKKRISQDSLASLKDLIPHQANLDVNQDLIGLAFDAAVVNMFNSNGDGISSKMAIRLYPSYAHKPINIEHERSDVVGHVLNAAFTDRTFHQMIPRDVASETLEPFNISLGGVIYVLVKKQLASLLQDIAEKVEKPEVVSASWELGFDRYSAAINETGSRFLKDCYVESNVLKVKELSKYMKAYGGAGRTPDGKFVYRLIDDPSALFLGIGLTSSPAASVSGVFVWNNETVPSSSEPSDGAAAKKSEEIISQFKQDVVITNDSGEDMTREEILALINEATASEKKEESVANIAKTIADAIVQQNEVYKAQVTTSEANAAKLKQEAEEAKQKLLSIEQSLAETKEKLEAFEKEKAVAAAKEDFNRRMAAVDEEFELTDEDRAVIAKRLTSIASEDEFSAYQSEIKVLMSAKSKVKIAEAKASLDKAVGEALKQELEKRGIKDPLEDKKTEEVSLANNSGEGSKQEQSLTERFASAFGENKVKASI